jgi:hypothetical protein
MNSWGVQKGSEPQPSPKPNQLDTNWLAKYMRRHPDSRLRGHERSKMKLPSTIGYELVNHLQFE